MSDRSGFLVAFLLWLTAVGVVVGVSGQAGANHGADVNYTVVPHQAPEDRRPGDTAASYRQFGVSNRDIAYLDYVAATWNAGGFSGCGPSDSQVLGIDRNNDDPGTEIDDKLEPYVEETTVDPHHFEIDFYERDDPIGTSTNLDTGDQLVGYVTDCYDNPPRPGWYRIRSSVGGWADDGSYIQRNVTSHYFWICDCSSERAARERLGPPPSEATPAATPAGGSTDSSGPTTTATSGISETGPQGAGGRTATGAEATPGSSPSGISESTTDGPAAGRDGVSGGSQTEVGADADGDGTAAGPSPSGNDGDSGRTATDRGASGIGPAGAVFAMLLAVLVGVGRAT